MPPINKIKITESGPDLLGINPKLTTDIYLINPSTTL